MAEHSANKYGNVNKHDVVMTSQEFVDTVNDLKNTPAEKEAVDKGVQENLSYQDARWHRREARRLLAGKPGLTNEQKVERMKRAKEHLEQSIALEIQSW